MNAAILRILDANFNRAGEGLRVLEEHARMVLGHPGMSQRAKDLRHELAAVRARIPASALLSARDVNADVGTSITTAAEINRADTESVATAAARRAAEALRCIEEYGKSVDAILAAAVEKIRYACYTLERDICLKSPAWQRLQSARLHVLISESLCGGPWLDVADRAIAGGADVLQLREKSLPDRELTARGRQLRELTRQRGALFAMNDRPDLARLMEADIVHVGQDDLSVAEARAIAGPGILVGKSTHDAAQIEAALHEAPDYLAVGPMFESRTKPGSRVAGPELLRQALTQCAGPIVAIGGIDAATMGQLPADARVQIAVCQAVIATADPAAAAQTLKQALVGRK